MTDSNMIGRKQSFKKYLGIVGLWLLFDFKNFCTKYSISTNSTKSSPGVTIY